jgi:hypothetical protein
VPHRVRRLPVIVALPVPGWRTVVLALGWSKAPRAIGSDLVRGLPEPHASAASFAKAPRSARNALRPIGQNGFDAHAPNANHGRMDDTRLVALRRSALVPHKDKDVLVPRAHTHMKTKQGSTWWRSRQAGSRASWEDQYQAGRIPASNDERAPCYGSGAEMSVKFTILASMKL